MTAYYNENDSFAAAWLRELIRKNAIAPGDVDDRSIAEVKPDDLRPYTQHHFFAGIGAWSFALRGAGWSDDDPVWTGSCPCQSFSQSGKRGGFDDRRHLWPVWYGLLREHRPRVVFGEQVASVDGLAWLDVVSADLEAAGYAFGAADLCAAGLGAPHIRQRIYFVADAGGRGLRSLGGEPGETAPEKLERSDAPGRRGPRGMDDALKPGLEGLARDESEGDQPGRDGAQPDRPSPEAGLPLRGFWKNGQWIACGPEPRFPAGSLRPVEPGSFPLADGIAGRVGRLRAYGNSLVAPVAEAFVRAYLGL